MKRKHYQKRHNSAPPLTKLDKAVYNFCIALSFAVPLALAFFLVFLRRRIAFSEPETAAVAIPTPLFLVIPLLVFLFLSGFLFFLFKKSGKVAIFGNKEAKYAWGEEPLFSKNRHPKTERQKSVFCKRLAAWSAGLALCLILAFPSVFTRTTLTEDFRLRHYNMFNVLTEEETEPFESAELNIFRVFKSGKVNCDFSVYVKTSEGGCTFREGDHKGDMSDALGLVEGIADRAEHFAVKNAENAPQLYENREMTPEQIARFEALLARAE